MWNIFVTTLSVLFVSWVLPGITVDGFWTALLAAVVIAVLEYAIGVVSTLLSLPFTAAGLAIFVFLLEAILVYSASVIFSGFEVANFGWALFAALIMFIIGGIFN